MGDNNFQSILPHGMTWHDIILKMTWHDMTSSYRNHIRKIIPWRHDADILSESNGQERSPSSCCRPCNNLLAILFECLSSRVTVLFTIVRLAVAAVCTVLIFGHNTQLQSELKCQSLLDNQVGESIWQSWSQSNMHWYGKLEADSDPQTYRDTLISTVKNNKLYAVIYNRSCANKDHCISPILPVPTIAILQYIVERGYDYARVYNSWMIKYQCASPHEGPKENAVCWSSSQLPLANTL